jgi:cysteinyl-tRNA synthetase
MQRVLTDYFNLDVLHVMGMTDVDDKIIARAKESGIHFTDIAKNFENEFWEDMQTLGVCSFLVWLVTTKLFSQVRKPMAVTRVSEHIPEIIKFVESILENGFGYVSQGGSVYFDTREYEKRYNRTGKLLPSLRNCSTSNS